MKSKWALTLFQIGVVILSCIVASWCLGIVREKPSLFFVVPIGGLHYLSVVFFNEIRDKGNKSILYYLAYVLVICMPVFMLKDIGGLEDVVGILAVGSIFISLVYYFTTIRFRSTTLILVLCLPTALCIRQGQVVVGLECIASLLVFVMLYQANVNQNSLGEGYEIIQKEKNVAYSLIILGGIVLGIYMIMPKPQLHITNPLAKILQQYVKENPKYDPSALPHTTSITETPGEMGERVLFHVKGDAPMYFKTRGWDGYKDNAWYIDDEYFNMGYGLDRSGEEIYNQLYTMLESLEMLDEAGMLEDLPELRELLTYEKASWEIRELEVIPQNYSMRMYLAPKGIIEVLDEEKVLLTPSGTCFNRDRSKPGTEPYVLTYIHHNLLPYTREMAFLEMMTPERYSEIKAVVQERLAKIWEISHLRILWRGVSKQEEAYEEALNLPYNISERTYELAKELTKDYESTYEQIQAIEAYFHTGEFYYDIEAEPIPEGKEGVDYFLFESKRGACVQFASAMTILCRAAGIPANLMEGYVCDTYDEKLGVYVIQEKHAHAFPEVYVPGYGWMIFEPTTANEATGLIGRGPLQQKGLFLIAGISLSILMGIVGGLMVWSLYERLWRVMIQYQKAEQQVMALYRRLLKRLRKKGYPIMPSTTPLQVQAMLQEQAIAISILVDQYQRVNYGGKSLSQEEVKQAFKCYKEVYSAVKKKKL